MNLEQEILSDIVVHMKYAKYIPEKKRRETWTELVSRNKTMHLEKFPELNSEIDAAYQYVYDKKVLPSMRSLQFAGKPIAINPARIYNCSYQPIDDYRAFSEAMFLLLSGVGFGYSVQSHHVDKLPEIKEPGNQKRFLVGDNIEGWSDAVKALLKAYLLGKPKPRFDFSDIRQKGSLLITSGGKAPGPEPLKICLAHIESILSEKRVGEKLTPLNCHDILCHIADAVLAGGIRRSAMIALFDASDEEMVSCKYGNWWELNPQRGRSNNSAVVELESVTFSQFFELWKKIELSNSGEPGIYFTNDREFGTNPCVETSLAPHTFCNLVEINGSTVDSQDEFENRCRAAAFINTLQASYTDFHYLRPIWKKSTERDALIGVGITGIGSNALENLDLSKAANIIKEVNRETAKRIGINCAARTTVIKPSGTTSLVLGTSSGIHAWFNDYYIRRLRVGKNESIYKYLLENHWDLLEDDFFRGYDTAIISIPQKAPENAILRTESVFDLLERTKKYNLEWVRSGHNTGLNYHNVSATISIKPEEWKSVGEWMWSNRKSYHGLSVLPYDGGTYVQTPFQDITEEKFRELTNTLKGLDLSQVLELSDETNLTGEAACAGGVCEIV